MFAAIFWDNDGVLMETEHLYYRANAEALARAGVELTLDTFRELSLRRGESVLQLAAAGEQDLRPWRDRRYRELLSEEAEVIPGVDETLARLYGSLPMAVVTSCRRENFLHMHRNSRLHDYFDFILTREDYGNSKPDPEPYLLACARAGHAPTNCLAVEDSERGVTAAARAGLTVVAVPGPLNRGGDFSAARWELESIVRLPDLVEIGR
jgi:HAD superfamily hydrolase (TIGR01509 family)